MQDYTLKLRPEKSVKVYGRGLNISRKSSVIVCKKLNGLNIKKGQKLLKNLIEKKQSLNGKYYTNVVKELSKLLESAITNAEFKGLNIEKLMIHISAHKGFTFYRPRRFKMRRTRRKITNIQVILEER